MGKLGKKSETPKRSYMKWWQIAAILVVGLLAHGGCLDSVFYLDDWWHIFNCKYVEGGLWYEDKVNILTNLGYFLTWKIFGFSTFWFHLFNLLLHMAGALAVYFFGRYLLELGGKCEESSKIDPEIVAWMAAMIFAAHPLTTEITNYARARDHEMVGFFSFLAACFTAMGIRRNWKWFIPAILAVGLAAISKGPGLPHGLLSVGIVLVFSIERNVWRVIWSNRWRVYTGIFIVEIFLFIFRNMIVELAVSLWWQLAGDWRFGWHALTQCRVFWSYIKLMIWPSGLCSDHLYAWTKSAGDVEAWIAAIALVILMVGILWLWIRGRQPWAILGVLALAALGLRWFYMSELMVEYRTYPAMPYVALLAALGVSKWWKHMPHLAISTFLILLIIFTVRSFVRSEDWSTSERLYNHVLRQYPLQLRALNCFSADDARAERWQSILDRHDEFLKKLKAVMDENKNNPNRYYENWPGWAVGEDCMVSEALLHQQGVVVARSYHEALFKRMKESHIDNPALVAEWHFVAGKIEVAAGNKKKARLYFLSALPYTIYPLRVQDELDNLQR